MTSIDFQFPLRQSTGPDVGMSFFSGRIHRWSCSDLCHKQVLLLRCTRSKMPPNKGDLEFDLEEIMQAREFAIQNRLNKPHACHSTGVRQALGHAWPRLAAGARRVPANAGSQNPAVKSWPRATGRTHNKPKHSNKGGTFPHLAAFRRRQAARVYNDKGQGASPKAVSDDSGTTMYGSERLGPISTGFVSSFNLRGPCLRWK